MNILISAALILAIAISAYSSHIFFPRMNKASTMSPPAVQLTPSLENLSPVMAAIEADSNDETTETSVKIPYENAPNFRKHLETASIQKGWFPYRTSDKGIHLIMPKEDLPEINRIQEDPIGWIAQENTRIDPPRGPSNLDLTSVQVKIDQTGQTAHAAWTILFIASVLSLLLLAVATGTYWLTIVIDNR